MKCQCIVILVIITFLSVGHAGVTARAEGKVESNRTLAGLRSIAVEVPDLDDTYRKALTADGISGSSLELSVEQQLEVAGIQVIPISQFKESDQYGLIRITLEILAPEALAKLGRIR
jgi:hypothetical protein